MSAIAQSRAFFADETRRRALIWEANSWVGTPFHGHAKLKGVGVDCVQLAGAIYIATGFLTEFNPGWYPIDGGNHDESSRVVEWIEQSGKFHRCSPHGAQAMPGDLICIQYARVAHHVGVVVAGEEFVHAMFNHHVMMSSLADSTYAKRLNAIYRPSVEEREPLQHFRD
jgi:cell wall-associated NlpC family hydrolase